MKEIIIQVNGYKSIAHIYITNETLFLVTINGHVSNVGGATLKGVIANTRRAIKRRG